MYSLDILKFFASTGTAYILFFEIIKMRKNIAPEKYRFLSFISPLGGVLWFLVGFVWFYIKLNME